MTAIAFVCVDPHHASMPFDRYKQHLTFHQEQWAVCPAGAPDGHTWRQTPKLNYEDLFARRPAEKT